MVMILDSGFDPAQHVQQFTTSCPSAGAITSFLGQVRSEDGAVNTLHLQSYPGVTEQGIQTAEATAIARWSLVGCLIIHRIGTLKIGEPIVLVATAAKHRRDAFEACDFLMDYLKTEAIFWKQQTGDNGSEWIEPRPEDYNDNKRWS